MIQPWPQAVPAEFLSALCACRGQALHYNIIFVNPYLIKELAEAEVWEVVDKLTGQIESSPDSSQLATGNQDTVSLSLELFAKITSHPLVSV